MIIYQCKIPCNRIFRDCMSPIFWKWWPTTASRFLARFPSDHKCKGEHSYRFLWIMVEPTPTLLERIKFFLGVVGADFRVKGFWQKEKNFPSWEIISNSYEFQAHSVGQWSWHQFNAGILPLIAWGFRTSAIALKLWYSSWWFLADSASTFHWFDPWESHLGLFPFLSWHSDHRQFSLCFCLFTNPALPQLTPKSSLWVGFKVSRLPLISCWILGLSTCNFFGAGGGTGWVHSDQSSSWLSFPLSPQAIGRAVRFAPLVSGFRVWIVGLTDDTLLLCHWILRSGLLSWKLRRVWTYRSFPSAPQSFPSGSWPLRSGLKVRFQSPISRLWPRLVFWLESYSFETKSWDDLLFPSTGSVPAGVSWSCCGGGAFPFSTPLQPLNFLANIH